MYEYSTKNDRVPPALRKEILERDRYTCRICKFRSPDRLGLLHIDHKHPKSKGGPTVRSNLRTLCGDCNMKRRNNTPNCPNCGDWVVEDKAFCPTCSHPVQPIARSDVKNKTTLNPAVRKLLLALAVVMIVFGLGSLAISFVSGLWNSFRGSVSQNKIQTGSAGQSCSIVDASGRANIKTKCDALDCDNDPSTVTGKIPAGTEVTKTGNSVASSLSSVGDWTEVSLNGQAVYVASTKLSCR